MDVCIIAVGSELLLGQITNTNAQFLSKQFNEVGYHVKEHIVVGDNPKRLYQVTQKALAQFDLVVFSGGLGPTKDDLTKQTIAQVLNKSLITDQEALKYIEKYFRDQDKTMTPNNKQQALVIEGSKVLPNEVGMAPGMYIETDAHHVVMLPGPPREMKPMVTNHLMPYLKKDTQTIHSEVLRFCGIGESQIETELIDLIDTQSNPTIAPLAGSHEVTIRLTANGSSIEACKALIKPVKQTILERVGQYYYGSDNITPEAAVLQHQSQTVAIYDGITEGLLNARLKAVKDHQLIKGYLLHHPTFINQQFEMEAQLEMSCQLVKQLFHSDQAISILTKENTVFVGFLSKDDRLTIETFKLSNERHIKRDRSQNYVMIRWLNWLKD